MNVNLYRGVVPAVSLFFLLWASCSDSFDGKNGLKTIKFPDSDKICQTIEYKDGKKNGILKEYYKNGNLRTIQRFKDNMPTDSSVFYHINGKLAVIQVHHDGKRAGCWKKYNEEGKLYSEICFKNGVFDGTASTYSYKSLHLIERYYYENGDKEGRQETFYNSGKPKAVMYYHKDQLCLGTEEWLENGEKVNNDFKIIVKEQDKLKLENRLYFFITLENPQPDDEVFLVLASDTGNVVTRRQTLERKEDHFILQYNIGEGGFVMEKARVAAYRKTRLGNTFIKTMTFNVSASNY